MIRDAQRHHHRLRSGGPDRRRSTPPAPTWRPLVIEGIEAGGQLMLTTLVENYPGYPRRHHGARSDGRDARAGRAVRRRDHPGQRHVASTCCSTPFTVKTSDAEYHARDADHRDRRVGAAARAAVRADADGPRRLDVRDLRRLLLPRPARSRSSAAATRRWKRRCSSRASPRKVTVVHRRDTLRASKIMQDKARANPKIAWMLDTEVEEITDTGRAKSRRWSSGTTRPARAPRCRSTGVFVAIGHTPNTSLFRGQLEMDRERLHASRTTARRRACPASSRAATCRITSTGRRSRPRAQAAWPRSTRKHYIDNIPEHLATVCKPLTARQSTRSLELPQRIFGRIASDSAMSSRRSEGFRRNYRSCQPSINPAAAQQPHPHRRRPRPVPA